MMINPRTIRSRRVVLIAGIASLLIQGRLLPAQTAVDSAAHFEQLARAELERGGMSVRPNMFLRGDNVQRATTLKLARQSFAFYEQRADELGQARATLLMAALFENGRQWDSSLVYARRALVTLRRPTTDSGALATAHRLIASSRMD